MRSVSQKAARFLTLAALIVFACVLALVTLGALSTTASSAVANNRMNQQVTLARDGFGGLALTAALLLALAAVHAFLRRRAGRRAFAAALALWTAAALCFVLAVGLLPRADSALVIDAAKRFAAGDFSPLEGEYFSRVSYQLGICLPLEGLARLLPGLDLNLLMQALNCVISAALMALLCGLAGGLSGDARTSGAAALLYLAFVPMLLFNMFVYGVLPMLLLCVLAMRCFARCARTGERRFGVLYALLIGAAAALKPNAMIVMLALLICAAVHALQRKDGFLLLCAALSAVLCFALPAGVIRLYELRAGVTLAPDTGMLLRLAMGMQDSMIAAGWYNGVIEEYWPLSVTPEMEKAAALEMLAARLREFAADPAGAWAFFKEKCLTQWAEPSYDILWYGAVCGKSGRFNGLAHAIFRDGSPVRALLAGYMNIFQQAAYVLALIGTCGMIREKRTEAVQLMLPVTVLGGFLYHMLFEAKSQYIYPYMLLLLPLAAAGMDLLAGRARNKRKEWRE
ncbi:MAG: hypothetical protein SO031_01750 [Candidatus Ventricola sp.]|nr:hypothetical protein [Candidatus Ventricola sp.]